jgi:hypothetical protein
VTEHPDERLVRDALEDYRAAVLPGIEPPGVAATRETARYRRRRRIATAAVAAVLALVAGGTATYAATRPHNQHPAPATSHRPAPSPSPSTGGGPSPTGSPSARHGQPPNGRISLTALDNATLDIPGWPGANTAICAPGRYTFHDGIASTPDFRLPGNTVIPLPDPVYGDVDGDGADETVALLVCGDHHEVYQAVAFDRNAAGRIVTLGAVTETPLGTASDLEKLDGLRAGPDGTVEVRWTQLHQRRPVSQWRGYRWSGAAFTQTTGPTSLPAEPSVDVSATATMSPTSTGYQGTLTVHVTNGAGAANAVTLDQVEIDLPSQVSATSVSGTRCDVSGSLVTCGNGELTIAPGGTATVVVQLTSDAAHQDTAQSLSGRVQLDPRDDSSFTGTSSTAFTLTLPAAG